jgi:hypothetical protein
MGEVGEAAEEGSVGEEVLRGQRRQV